MIGDTYTLIRKETYPNHAKLWAGKTIVVALNERIRTRTILVLDGDDLDEWPRGMSRREAEDILHQVS